MNPEIEQAAADWIARRYAGFSPADSAEFERWLAADPRHAAVFGEMDAAWRALDRVRESAASTAGPDPDALAPRSPRHAVRRFAPLLAAAAVAIVAYAGWRWSAPETEGSGWRTVRQMEPFAETVTTAVGMVQKLTLPDGSVLRLNTDSLVEIAYSAVERRVRLVRGEAHFTVAKNPMRPFFVEVKGVAVRAVGTAFNVRLHAEAVEVLVTEGKVRVVDVAGEASLIAPRTIAPSVPEGPLLAAGERAVISLGPVPGEKFRPVPVALVLPIGNWIFRRIGSGRGSRGGCRVETESDPCSPPNLKSA